ncbi:MAG TPA: helicase-related protein [Xanthobacteraceae bacterium]|nr:helicase-related protein [Xanthobacteraceae bacterium]
MAVTLTDRPRDARLRGAGVTAVLGPTNTGKTHLAIERMLGHSSGIIGLPLRLLAREVYNKIVARIGADAVALITGEEKIKPANPRYWVSTVEAMPRDIDVAFLAIDEIQLCAELERGHVFTDRLLNRRGREETLMLGAATMRSLVEKLLPGANMLSRPRLSMLTFSGEKKITRLPRRSAVVAFSAEEVYAIAELIRRQRGGAAVVLGALSPRTRNAQVAMYQNGDVDYLVATDAIGMGLNLDVDHVAFASDRKFDGYQFRKLNPVEFAQIAGRAGRHMRDGTFGTTGRCPPFEDDLVRALESHAFDSVKVLQWRNSDLDFSSIGALTASLAASPGENGLTRAPMAEDVLVLEHAARDEDIRTGVRTRSDVERLWDVCQVPDYRKLSPSAHAELVTALYGFLSRAGKIPNDWYSSQITQADRTDGGIDTLSARIAHIRTWTFVANRPDWLDDPEHWQGVARGVEDRLSDALHERLAERFVDRRTSVLMRRLKENTMLETEISKTGDVVVEGHSIGRLEGFRFSPDASAGGSEAKMLSGAAQKALAGEIEQRAVRLSQAPDAQFVLTSDGTIRWIGEAVAKLTAGDNVLRPRVRIISDEHLTGPSQELVQTRLDLWTRAHIERLLGPLLTLSAAEDITGIARGIAFQVVEALGVLERSQVANDVKSLEQASRAALRNHGVRFGAYHLYVPSLLKPAPRALAAQLWALKFGGPDLKGLDDLQRLAASGRTSMPVDKEVPKALYRTVGYRVCGERAVRVDILERLADLIRPAIAWRDGSAGVRPAGGFGNGGFIVTQPMTSLTGASGEDFASILRSLGYRMERRPKPPEPAVVETPAITDAAASPEAVAGDAAAMADTPADVTADVSAAEATAEQIDAEISEGGPVNAGDEPDGGVVAAHGEGAADVDPPAAEPLPDTEAESATVSADAVTADVAASAAALAEAAPPEGAATETATVTEAPPAADATPAEPAMIEVWRPGGRSPEERRPRRRPRPERKPGSAPAQAGEAGAVAAETAEGAADKAREARENRRKRYRPNREAVPAENVAKPPGEGEREDRGDRKKFSRPERRDRSERQDGEERRPRRDRDRPRGKDRGDDNRPAREWSSASGRSNEPDPNSPFAKLAALKAQMESGGKDR